MTIAMDDKSDIQRLADACQHNKSEPALGHHLKTTHWEQLVGFLQPALMSQGQVLITQGATERTVYFIESGSLSVHYEDSAGRVKLAIVNPGAALGEGSFFSHLPRKSTVQAASASRVWVLTAVRFAELCNRQPALALAITLALGSLMASRLVDRRKRIAVT